MRFTPWKTTPINMFRASEKPKISSEWSWKGRKQNLQKTTSPQTSKFLFINQSQKEHRKLLSSNLFYLKTSNLKNPIFQVSRGFFFFILFSFQRKTEGFYKKKTFFRSRIIWYLIIVKKEKNFPVDVHKLITQEKRNPAHRW